MKSRTSSGELRIDASTNGTVDARTSSGDVGVAIPEGTAAMVDIVTGSGTVTSRLQPADGPEDGEDTVMLHVRSGSGDVDIHRSRLSRGAEGARSVTLQTPSL